MNIYIAGDKHGYDVIQIVREWLDDKDMKYEDLGVQDSDTNLPLEEMLPNIATKILSASNKTFGIVCCGTGIGTEVGINKLSGIRAVLAADPEIAEWSRIYDNCNVLCLIGWRKDKDNIRAMLEKWFTAEYDGSEKRLRMMREFDKWH